MIQFPILTNIIKRTLHLLRIGNPNSIAWSVIYDHGDKVRLDHDTHLKTEILAVCRAIDDALGQIGVVDSTILHRPEQEKMQIAHSIGALRKAINDIFGSLDSLRDGHLDQAHGSLRMVHEGFATAILVAHDEEIYKDYAQNKYSVNKSVQNIRTRYKDLGLSSDTVSEFEEAYKVTHMSAHPTFPSIGLAYDFNKKRLALGGVFLNDNLSMYRAHLRNLEHSSKNITAFIKARLI